MNQLCVHQSLIKQMSPCYTNCENSFGMGRPLSFFPESWLLRSGLPDITRRIKFQQSGERKPQITHDLLHLLKEKCRFLHFYGPTVFALLRLFYWPVLLFGESFYGPVRKCALLVAATIWAQASEIDFHSRYWGCEICFFASHLIQWVLTKNKKWNEKE